MAIKFDPNDAVNVTIASEDYDITCPNFCGKMIPQPRWVPQDKGKIVFWCPKCTAVVEVPKIQTTPEFNEKYPLGTVQGAGYVMPGPGKRKYHLNGQTPKPSNSACTVSKICGPDCQSCGCPAYYVEVERQFSIDHDSVGNEHNWYGTPRITRIICANCRKRTHQQIIGKIVRIKDPETLATPAPLETGDRSRWSPAYKGQYPRDKKLEEARKAELVRIQHAAAGLKEMKRGFGPVQDAADLKEVVEGTRERRGVPICN